MAKAKTLTETTARYVEHIMQMDAPSLREMIGDCRERIESTLGDSPFYVGAQERLIALCQTRLSELGEEA